MSKKFISLPFSQAKTVREANLLEALQWTADMINNCMGSYIEDVTDKLDELGIEYHFTDTLDE